MVLYYPFFAKSLPPDTATPEWYAEIMEKAAACIEDGECEARCPYYLPIREMIAENYKLYEAQKKKYQK